MTEEIRITTLEKSLRESGFYKRGFIMGAFRIGSLEPYDGQKDTKDFFLRTSKYTEEELIDLANQVVEAFRNRSYDTMNCKVPEKAGDEIYIAPGHLVGSDQPFVIYRRTPKERA